MKSAIFDLDGVIVDTAKFHYLAWKEIAQKFNYKLTQVQNEKLKGISRKDSLSLLLKWSGNNLSNNEFNNLLADKNDLYLDQIKNLTKKDSLPGINKTLNYLKN
jgi:beta-phosphoglucomutase